MGADQSLGRAVLQIVTDKTILDADLSKIKDQVASAGAAASASASGGFNQAATQLGRIRSEASGARPEFNSLTDSLRSFDGVLQTAGISIGREIQGINDLRNAASKTVGELGLLATAGLTVGSGVVGWNIGRAISGFFDLDNVIGNATAKLMGWGDVAAQTAAAKTEALAAASKHAGREITTMGEALIVNTAWLEKNKKAAQERHAELEKEQQELEHFKAAMVELDSVGQGWAGTLDTINGRVVEAIKYYLEAGVSQSALATAYGLTAAQVKAVASAMQDAIEVAKILDQVHETGQKLALDRWKAEQDAIKATLERRNQMVIEGLTQIQEAEKQLSSFTIQQTQVTTDEQVRQIWEVARQQVAAFKGSEDQRLQFNQVISALAQAQTDDLIAKARTAGDGIASAYEGAATRVKDAMAFIGSGFPTPDSLRAAALEPGSMLGLGMPGFGATGVSTSGLTNRPRVRDNGGPVSAGMPYLVGRGAQPELFVPDSSGSMVPAGGYGGVTVNIYGSVLSDEGKIARAVRNALDGSLRGAGARIGAS